MSVNNEVKFDSHRSKKLHELQKSSVSTAQLKEFLNGLEEDQKNEFKYDLDLLKELCNSYLDENPHASYEQVKKSILFTLEQSVHLAPEERHVVSGQLDYLIKKKKLKPPSRFVRVFKALGNLAVSLFV